MALQIFGTATIGAGLIANLTTSDDVIVLAAGAVGSTTGDAIAGTGSNHKVNIHGSVVASAFGISLGDSSAIDNNNVVNIASTGFIFGQGVGMRLLSFSSTVVNEGLITGGGYGIILGGESAGTVSTVTNSGTIKTTGASGEAISHFSGGTEAITVTNSGLIQSLHLAYDSSYAVAVDKIINTGKIIGGINLDAGNDVYSGTNGRLSGEIFGGSGDDILRGGIDNDKFNGGEDNDRLYGGKGNDILAGDAGNDVLYGDDGIDKIYGGHGKDTLWGGTGKDTFVFKSVDDSTVGALGRDVIKDFARGDRIDLKSIDASTSTSGDQAFAFIGTEAFHKSAGELRYEIKSGDTYIQGDVNGDGKADFSIALDLSLAMTATDFIL